MCLHPTLSKLKLPPEISIVVILFSGVGIGSLMCDLVARIICFIKARYEKYRLNVKTAEKIALESKIKEENEKAFTEKFKQAYEHFSPKMKEILRELLSNDRALSETTEVNDLISAKLIIKIADIDRYKKLFKINPLISEYVRDQWESEIQNNIDGFLSYLTPLKTTCLELLELNENSFDGKARKLKKSLFTNKYDLHPVLDSNYHNPSESFFIYFNPGYLKAMEKRLSKEFVDEIEVVLKQ